MSFPSLKMLWSRSDPYWELTYCTSSLTGNVSIRSPSATADIFRSIVSNHEPVDVLKAVSVGAVGGEAEAAAGGEDGAEMEATAAAQEILLSLPGVNVHNFREVMNSVQSVAELSTLSEAQLVPLIGPVNARKLFTFFKQRRLA